jgi:hypothetical protein
VKYSSNYENPGISKYFVAIIMVVWYMENAVCGYLSGIIICLQRIVRKNPG